MFFGYFCQEMPNLLVISADVSPHRQSILDTLKNRISNTITIINPRPDSSKNQAINYNNDTELFSMYNELLLSSSYDKINYVLCGSSHSRRVLQYIYPKLTNLQWIHVTNAGMHK